MDHEQLLNAADRIGMPLPRPASAEQTFTALHLTTRESTMLRFLVAFVLGLIVAAVLLSRTGASPADLDGTAILLGSGLVFSLPFFLLRPPPRYHILRLSHSLVTLERPGRSRSFHPADLTLALLQNRISFDGGRLLVPRRLLLLTNTERLAVDLDPEPARACFDALRTACPRALFVDEHSRLHPPACPDRLFGTQHLERPLRALFGRLARRHALVGLTLTLGGAAFIIAAALAFTRSEESILARASVWAIVAIFAGLYHLAPAIRYTLRLRRLQQALAHLLENLDSPD